jgi:predicted O-methyltransferase YrrM
MGDPDGKLQWTDREHLRVGRAEFFLTFDPEVMAASESGSEHFVLVKGKSMVESLAERAPRPTEYICDLGIYKGGSIALCQELFQPKRLVGIELSTDRVTALDQFISEHSLHESIHLHYGTPQHDKQRLSGIVQEEFGDAQLDLVVDDCSHRFEQTKASFNVLFPRMRPGGLYVIEDWGSAHWPGDRWQRKGGLYSAERNPLSRLILELVMVSASRPELVKQLIVDGTTVYVQRGNEEVSDAGFDISRSYLTSGRRILYEHTQSRIPTGREIVNYVRHHSKRRATT